jgi:hypothetical protein
MKFTLEIEMDNAAFGDPSELSRVLRQCATDVADLDRDDGRLRDINGNTVGRWSVQ